MKNIKVLLVYVNSMMDNMVPGNVSMIAACLKQHGHEVELFDTTCYKTQERSADEKRVEHLQIRPFDLSEYGIKLKETDVYEDFLKKVVETNPDLIGVSLVETTYDLGIDLLRKVQDLGVPNIVGGPHAILDPEGLISEPVVDMICTGEGEELIGEVAERVMNKKPFDDVKGLWFKRDGKIVRNPNRACLVDLDKIPYMDFSIYDKERFYKPMAGKIYKMVPIEMSRGCCYNCNYCCDQAFNKTFKDIGKWYRQKSIKRIFDEIDFFIKKYKAQYLYFVSETFLAMSTEKFKDFVERYKEIKLPFWFNTRPETVTEEKIKMLDEIGCDRISVGMEHGNEEFRRKMLNRLYTNDTARKAINIIKNSKIAISVNNIIGFPDETRELIFDTIRLNRSLELRKKDSISCFMLSPFKGTVLRKICVEKGMIDKDKNVKDNNIDYILNHPLFKDGVLMGLMRTFTSYCRLPEEYFPLIEKAEKFTEEGDKSFEKVKEIYENIYFS